MIISTTRKKQGQPNPQRKGGVGKCRTQMLGNTGDPDPSRWPPKPEPKPRTKAPQLRNHRSNHLQTNHYLYYPLPSWYLQAYYPNLSTTNRSLTNFLPPRKQSLVIRMIRARTNLRCSVDLRKMSIPEQSDIAQWERSGWRGESKCGLIFL